MSKFEESNFYKALQDFFINADKKTFLQFLAEFYNRTEGIIDKDNIQDDLIKELRELYLEFNEKGIDENIVREKVNYFLENSSKIKSKDLTLSFSSGVMTTEVATGVNIDNILGFYMIYNDNVFSNPPVISLKTNGNIIGVAKTNPQSDFSVTIKLKYLG